VLVGTNIIVALCLVSAGVVYGYVRYRVSQLKTVKCPSCVAGGSGGPMNILLIGSNTRAGLDPNEAAQFGSADPAACARNPSTCVQGARSDVTMILHLDPATGSASLLSIPRDLFVPLPPHSMAGSFGKIDGALNDSPDNLIAAINNVLGIPINHFINVNFDGFQRTIDAIGGIKMNFPMPLRDAFSALHIPQTGCQSLNGATALAVVRARHLQYFANGRWNDDPQSDLARIRRDHTFLRIFVNTAKAQVTNPFRLNNLVSGLLNQVTVDRGLGIATMLSLFRHYKHLNPDTVPETTLPITVVVNYHRAGVNYGDVDMPVEPLDHQVINAWDPQPKPADPSGITVRVVNISGQSRKAATVARQLAGLGYTIAGTSTGTRPATTTETVIRYHPGSVAQAAGLLDHLSGAVIMDPDATLPDGTLTLDVGSVVAVTTPTPPPSTTASSATQAAPPTTAATVPTAGSQPPSSPTDQPQPFDPTACTPRR
jgi:LCP family protein required for cell wall assembly